MGKISLDRRYNSKKFEHLATHYAVDEIENMDMDDGVFFVHLKDEYEYAENGYGHKKTMSFTNISEARKELKKVVKV
jgi:hypothetical protein